MRKANYLYAGSNKRKRAFFESAQYALGRGHGVKRSLLKIQSLEAKIKALGMALAGLITAKPGDTPIDRHEANKLFLRLCNEREIIIKRLVQLEGK